ncbi:DUF447 domain-containing protein [Lacipirellula sp.]|uniref:DUF447 domain-containing protein n=1 Tax=Lacipirellula sp. TaxID=2691419 RepID=UPI003D132FCA
MPADETPRTPPTLGAEGRILEGIVTTLNADGSVNVSPMGPIVDDSLDRLWLRPFQTSTTYRNLKRTGRGVFHVTDEVELLAQAAVGQPASLPRFTATPAGDALILADACRWYAFDIESLDDAEERTSIVAKVTDRGTLREFLGFNRAQHAVLEAAILATRVHLTGAAVVLAEYDRLQIAVDKTGAAAEHRALAFLRSHVSRAGEQAGQQQ